MMLQVVIYYENMLRNKNDCCHGDESNLFKENIIKIYKKIKNKYFRGGKQAEPG